MARKIFINYSKQDTECILKLAPEIEDVVYPVWISSEIGGGQQWQRMVDKVAWELIALSRGGK